MKFSIFASVRAQRGELCTAEKFHEVTSSADVERICAAISHETDKDKIAELKKQLPIITWQAYFEGKRLAKEAQPSGLFMLDIDHVPNPFELWTTKIVSKREALGIVFCGMTASRHGLRIVAKCRPEFNSLESCQRWLSSEIGVEYDSVCKDFARSSFVVSSSYTYYLDGRVFTDEPADGTVYPVSQVVSMATAEPKTVGKQTQQSTDQDQREGLFGGGDYTYKGIALSEIADEWLKQNGGMPDVGLRNTMLYKLSLRMRYLTDFNAAVIMKVIPHCGLPESEVKGLVTSAVNTTRAANIPKDLQTVLDVLDKRIKLGDMGDDEDPEIPEISTDTSTIPSLPPCIRQFVETAPDDFKQAVILCQLPILGTLGSKLRARYLDGTLHSPSFQTSLEAPQASGKSFLRRLVEYELGQLIEHDEQEREKEREYDAKVKELKLLNQKITAENKDDILGSRPQTLIRYVPATISITKLLQRMNSAQGLHLFALSEEIDTVTKAFKRGFSSYSDLLRVSFDNAIYGQDYASENSFSGNLKIYYNFLTSGTPKAMRRFYPDVEDGLVSRVCFVTLPDQFGKPMPVWKELTTEQKRIIDVALVRLNEVTIQGDTVQPDHVMKLEFLNAAMKKWIISQQQEAVSNNDRTRDIFCRRSAVVGFRAGMLAWFLWGEKNTPTIRRNTMNFAIYVANCMLNQHLLRFQIENTGSNTIKYEEALEELGDEFTRDELRVALLRHGYNTDLRDVIYRWKLAGVIEAIEKKRSAKGPEHSYKFKKVKK